MNDVNQQRSAVLWVKSHNGDVAYDFEYESEARSPPVPQWVCDTMGIDCFATVESVTVGAPVDNITPLSRFSSATSISIGSSPQLADLRPLAKMESLYTLFVADSGVSDVTPLRGHANLHQLSLAGTQITSLDALADLKALEYLVINRTPIADLTPLQELRQLRTLRCESTDVTDLRPVAGMQCLSELRIKKTRVSDLSPLQGLSGLVLLDADDTAVKDVSPLAGLERLEHLYLDRTEVTDITDLEELRHLRVLSINETPVTQEQVGALKRKLPKCRIIWSERHLGNGKSK